MPPTSSIGEAFLPVVDVMDTVAVEVKAIECRKKNFSKLLCVAK